MKTILPIKENANKGFHYTVTDEQIEAYRKRSLEEIMEWLESTARFVYELQTEEERKRMREMKSAITGE